MAEVSLFVLQKIVAVKMKVEIMKKKKKKTNKQQTPQKSPTTDMKKNKQARRTFWEE